MNINAGLSTVQIACKSVELLSNDENTVKKAKVAGDVMATAKSVKVIAGAGTVGAAVMGASGAAIMSTLATAGAIVGGGVVAGVGIVAGSAGAGAATLLNRTAFKDSTKAKVGTYAGAAVGTAGSLGTLAVAGAGPVGLASIGSVVGGGMAAGAITVLAAPVACAAAVGGLVYWATRRKRDDSLQSDALAPKEPQSGG